MTVDDRSTLEQGPVSSLRADDLIVLRQSNGRDMYLPVGVLAAYVADAVKKARIPVDQVDDLPTHVANAIGAALDTFEIPAERVTGLALVAKTGKYSDLHGKPGDPPGPPGPPGPP